MCHTHYQKAETVLFGRTMTLGFRSPRDRMYNIKLKSPYYFLLVQAFIEEWPGCQRKNCHLHVTLGCSTSSYFAALTDFNDTRPILSETRKTPNDNTRFK